MWSYALMLFAFAGVSVAITNPSSLCSNQYDCKSIQENVTWAIDGRRCFVFRNACEFDRENCEHRKKNLTPLTVVPREKCQILCNERCTPLFAPICAEYHGQKRTFTNNCDLENYICQSGETYVVTRGGACENRNTLG